jgi:hypothetical protein
MVTAKEIATMSNIGIASFHREFVTRTQEILRGYKGKREFTNLVNCALGLIILPHEQMGRQGLTQGIWGKKIDEVPQCRNMAIGLFEPIKDWGEFYPKTLGYFLKKVRNGFGHGLVTPINQGEKWVAITVENYFPSKDALGAKQDLQVTFTMPQLRDFALFIADEYLKS